MAPVVWGRGAGEWAGQPPSGRMAPAVCVGAEEWASPPPSGRVAVHLPAPQTGSCERGFSMPAPQRADLQWTAAHCHTARTAQRRRPSWAALIPGTTDEVAVVLPCWKVMM